MQCYVGQALVKHARFPIGATITAATTHMFVEEFAVPREFTNWSELRTTKGEELSSPAASSSFDDMHRHSVACCNHLSYACSCVKLGLHTVFQCNAQDMQSSVKRFARVVERGAGWPELVVCGAPRALGDVFLACVGAITIDGMDINAADTLLEAHVERCALFESIRPVSVRKLPDMTVETLTEVIARAGPNIRISALASPAPPHPAKDDAPVFAEQLQRLAVLTDVEVRIAEDELVVGVSPRTAALSDPLAHAGFSEMEVGDHGTTEDSASEAGAVEMKPPATNKAVYCEDCKKWLNGPD